MDFSLLCAVHGATSRGLREMLESLKNQTNQSYELVLVVGAGRPKDQAMVQALLPAYPAARMVLRPNQETLATSATALLDSLTGNFVGFIGFRDCLQPTALAAALNAFSEHPSAKVVFTDEECRDALNHITQRFDKLGLNPMRLRSQEYLRDLVLIDRNWLIQLGGFNPVTSEWPSHDIYLKTLELLGTSAFVHIPERLYQRFRVYRDRPADLRRRAHLPGFDTQAVRLHLQRQQIPATLVDHHRGTLQINYDLKAFPWVQVFVITDGTADVALRQVQRATSCMGYNAAKLTVVSAHTDSQVAADLGYACRALGISVFHVPSGLPAWLNQEISRADATYVALLRGEPLTRDWLYQLLSHAQLSNVGVVTGKCLTQAQVIMPGVINHRYEGWDWNSRGKFNLLQVTHNTSAPSSWNMLFSTQSWVDRNGFDPQLTTLFGMEFGMRMVEAGLQNIGLPSATIMVTPIATPDAEAALFKGRWSAWSDPYGLILPW